jgi:AraC-like DNA-binding protein
MRAVRAPVLNRGDKKRLIASMDYREHLPPPHLEGLVKSCWTLDAGGEAGQWIAQQATPDGCVELIRRLAGRSRWDGDQPERFAVGLVERPQSFSISGDSRFEAVRLWPWAWPLVSAVPLAEIAGRWAPHEGPGIEGLAAPALAATGRAILGACSAGEMARATGMSPRTLQRWFARNVGLTPRRYLRLLRFQKAFEQVPGQPSLADHAAAQGFADQAHMARAFRELAGVPAGEARRSARGPFLTRLSAPAAGSDRRSGR